MKGTYLLAAAVAVLLGGDGDLSAGLTAASASYATSPPLSTRASTIRISRGSAR